MNNLLNRIVTALLHGFVAFLIAAVLLAIASALIPGVNLTVIYYATIVGVLYGLYVFLTGARNI